MPLHAHNVTRFNSTFLQQTLTPKNTISYQRHMLREATFETQQSKHYELSYYSLFEQMLCSHLLYMKRKKKEA